MHKRDRLADLHGGRDRFGLAHLVRTAAQRFKFLVGVDQVDAAVLSESFGRALKRGMTDRLREREHAAEDLAEIFAASRGFIIVRTGVAIGIRLSLGNDRGFRSFACLVGRCVLRSLC